MRNIDSKSRPRTQFRFKYLAVRIRLLRLGGSLTTFSTVSVKSGHLAVQLACPLYPRKRTFAVHHRVSAMGRFCCKSRKLQGYEFSRKHETRSSRRFV